MKDDQRLPTLKDRPRSDVILYDARCSLCIRSVERLARWDRRRELTFLALDAPERAERFPQFAESELDKQMHLIDRAGRVHRGAEALRVIVRRVPRLWPLVPLLHVPGSLPFWQWLYRSVARWRYRFGRAQACDDNRCATHSGKLGKRSP